MPGVARKLAIAVAPNEDGLGTSAWAVRIVKELLRKDGDGVGRIQVVVASKRLAEFHADKYPAAPVEVLRLEGISDPIRLVKTVGGVDVEATLETAVVMYGGSRRAYREALNAQRVLERADVVVDLGVPQLVRAVWEENRRRQARGQRPIAAVTVLDHRWSRTLSEMAEREGLLREDVQRALALMREDEALTPEVLLLPEPVTPTGYQAHWREVAVRRLPGVLGGPRWAQQWAGRDSRRTLRRLLGIEDELPVLHVSGGGTSVWDTVLAGLLDDYAARPPRYHVAVFSPAEARRRGVSLQWRRQAGREVQCGRLPSAPRVIFLGGLAGETHHVLFAGLDLVLSRAGGGTVNDAIAFRVPLVLVEEARHCQVEQIRQACLRMGICRTAELRELGAGARKLVEGPGGDLLALEQERRAMEQVPNHAEAWLADYLLKRAQQGG